jgi:alpha-tubulin suppressor-like RCC1 family protein
MIKKTSLLFFTLLLLNSISSLAQQSRSNTKNQAAHRGNYQRMATSGGSDHNFEIREGTLWAWGNDLFGQLGTGSSGSSSNIPVKVGNDNNWVAAAAGYAHSLGLRSNGTIWAWGRNAQGNLGDGTTVDRLSPVQIGSDSNWINIAVGSFHSLGIKSDGTLWSWGNNLEGQLGDGTYTHSYVPVRVGTDNKWVSISGGGHHTIGLKSDGTLWAWGWNAQGQLGDGTTIRRNTPAQLGTAGNWVSAAATMEFSIALKADGTLWGWGENSYGQLGDGTSTDQMSPVQIGTDNSWVKVSAGAGHCHAIKSNGSIWAWGFNGNGQLGDGTTTNSNIPVNIGNDHKWLNVSSGRYHSLALKSDGSLLAWGFNNSGQIGDSTYTTRHAPVFLRADSQWVTLSGGSDHSQGIRSNGSLWAWGFNGNAQLGDGAVSSMRYNPVRTGTDDKWVSVSAGAYYSLALKSDGTIWGWGENIFGQIGNGSTNTAVSPVQVGSDTDWVSISAGHDHSLGLKSNGTLWSWGSNLNGQLGNGSVNHNTSPQQMGSDNDWVSIAAGNASSRALKSNGTLWAWGWNGFGQLGDGTTTDRYSPVQVGSDNNWVQISAGGAHTLGLKTDGSLWAWGYNNFGQLGDGGIIANSYPVQIGSDNNWISVAAGNIHSLGLKADGTIWSWGRNVRGELGDGTTAQRNSPVQAGSSIGWVSIAAANVHSLALKADRSGFCAAGGNFHAQLADGTTTDRATFVCNSVNCTPPPAPVSMDVKACSGSKADLTAYGSGIMYWYNLPAGGSPLGGITNSGVSEFTTPVLSSDMTYYVEDSTCATSSSRTAVKVTVGAILQVTVQASSDSICQGSEVTLSGKGASFYTWTNGVTDGMAFVPSSTLSYLVTGTDTNNCSDTAMITVAVLQKPSVTAAASANTVCQGTMVTLTGSGADSLRWSGGVKNGIAFIPSITKDYTVIGTDSNNCSDTAMITINVNLLPHVTANASDDKVCDGEAVVLYGGGASNYTWTGGITDSVSFVPDSSFTYKVTGTDANNCLASDSITIMVNPFPVVTTAVTGTFILAEQAGAEYQWVDCNNGFAAIPGDTLQGFTAKVNGSYAVIVTLNSCTDTSACENITNIGISKNAGHAAQLIIYPNPAGSIFTVQSNSPGSYSITNSMGQVLRSFELNAANNFTIQIGDLESGIYFITGINDNKISRQKVIVAK